MSELLSIWNDTQLRAAAPPPPFAIPNNPNAKTIKLNNQSCYWIIIFKTSTNIDVDRIEPFSYLTIPFENDISIKIDTANNNSSSLKADHMFVDYSTINGGVITFAKGSTQFSGSSTINVEGGTLDINSIGGQVETNIQNAYISDNPLVQIGSTTFGGAVAPGAIKTVTIPSPNMAMYDGIAIFVISPTNYAKYGSPTCYGYLDNSTIVPGTPGTLTATPTISMTQTSTSGTYNTQWTAYLVDPAVFSSVSLTIKNTGATTSPSETVTIAAYGIRASLGTNDNPIQNVLTLYDPNTGGYLLDYGVPYEFNLVPSGTYNSTSIDRQFFPPPGMKTSAGIMIMINVTSVTGTPSIGFLPQIYWDSASGMSVPIASPQTYITGVGFYRYIWYPSVTENTNTSEHGHIQETHPLHLPYNWHYQTYFGDNANYTYTIDAVLLP